MIAQTAAREKVLELGEDSDRWIVLGTTEVDTARVAVIAYLHAALIPCDAEAFSETVEVALSAEAMVIDECRILVDPRTEIALYQSPIGGCRIPDEFELLGRNAVVFGMRLPDHRSYLAAHPVSEVVSS
jgi:hypothetical protein